MALQAPARIIVVDDDSSVREALEMILAGAGHTIRGRGTACGAAALLWEQLPQLVVPANAVGAWQEREPQTWALLCDWLSEQGKSVLVV